MLRIIIQQLAIFLLPILLYSVYFLIVRQRAQMGGHPKPSWEEGPWYWLVLSGLVLTIVTFALFGVLGGSGTDAIFEPPRLEDGKVKPGTMTK